MTFPNSSSCVVCLKMYLRGAGSQRDVTRAAAVNLNALRNLPCFTQGKGPNRAALQTCEQTHSLISVSPHWVEDSLNALSCTRVRNTLCSVALCVYVTQLKSPLAATVKWGMGEVIATWGEQVGDIVPCYRGVKFLKPWPKHSCSESHCICSWSVNSKNWALHCVFLQVSLGISCGYHCPVYFNFPDWVHGLPGTLRQLPLLPILVQK